ncbi:MAG: glycerol-3-phosphate dehydrogenase C-terminal domain-containing protein [Microbacterium sp.]
MCTDDEIDYFDLIAQVQHLGFARADRLHVSGIRPLPRHDDVAPGFVSRDYRIERASARRRARAEPRGRQVDDVPGAVRAHLHRRDAAPGPSPHGLDDEDLAIGGGAGWARHRRRPAPGSRRTGVRARGRVRRSHARALRHLRAELLSSLPVTQHPLAHAPGYSQEEIALLAAREEVVSLIDLLLRRTSIAFVGGVTGETLVEVATAAAPALGWDASEIDAQVATATEVLRDAHRIDVSTASLAPQPA